MRQLSELKNLKSRKGIIAASVVMVIGAAITIFIGIWILSLVISSISLPYDSTAVVNETHNSTGSIPETLTATTPEDGLTSDSETIYILDIETGTDILLAETTNYTVISYTLGTFNISSCPVCNGTSDQYKLSYTSQDTNDAADTTFSQVQSITWNSIQLLAIGLIVMAFAVIMTFFAVRKK